MDIRDELKRLNDALWCRNFVAVPSTLRRIARNTARKRLAEKRPTKRRLRTSGGIGRRSGG